MAKTPARKQGTASPAETPPSPRPIRRITSEALMLAAILACAVALRTWGLRWGLPDAMHLFSFHPDESIMLTTSLPQFGGIDLSAGKFLPHYYDYGSLPFYLINIAVLIGSGYHLIGPIVTARGIDPNSFAAAYLAARVISVAMGVGTVWAAYAVGRRLWSPAAGLLAALLLAVIPLHVQHSHFATVDVGAAFWQMLSLVWAAKLLRPAVQREKTAQYAPDFRKAARYAALAGIFAGLTAATKYSGVLVLLASWVAILLVRRDAKARIALIAIAGFCALGAFVITCPGCILETGRFLQGIRYESNHVMHHGEIYFQGTGLGWLYIVARNLDAGMGLPLLIVSLASVIYAAVRRRPEDALLAAFALPYYLITGAAESRYARYEIPLLPIFALWSARMLVDIAGLPILARRTVSFVFAAVVACGVVFTLADTWIIVSPMAGIDTRESAAIWLNRHAPSPTKIGFGELPWFWTASIDPLFSAPWPRAWINSASASELARYCYSADLPLDPSTISALRPPVITLSEYEYYDALRLRMPNALQYVRELNSGYNAPVVFAAAHPLGGMKTLDGLPVQDLPTDMLYTEPTILIYTRR